MEKYEKLSLNYHQISSISVPLHIPFISILYVITVKMLTARDAKQNMKRTTRAHFRQRTCCRNFLSLEPFVLLYKLGVDTIIASYSGFTRFLVGKKRSLDKIVYDSFRKQNDFFFIGMFLLAFVFVLFYCLSVFTKTYIRS